MLYLLTFFDRAEMDGQFVRNNTPSVINRVAIFFHFVVRAIKL